MESVPVQATVSGQPADATEASSLISLPSDVLTLIMLKIADATANEGSKPLANLARFSSTCKTLRNLYLNRYEVLTFRNFIYLQQAMCTPGLYSRTETTVIHRAPGHAHVIAKWTADDQAIIHPLADNGSLIPQHCIVNLGQDAPASGFQSEWCLRGSLCVNGVDYSLCSRSDGQVQILRDGAVVQSADVRVAKVVTGSNCLVVLSSAPPGLIPGVALVGFTRAMHVLHVTATGEAALVPLEQQAYDIRAHNGSVYLYRDDGLFTVECDGGTATVKEVPPSQRKILKPHLGEICIPDKQYTEWSRLGDAADDLGGFCVGPFARIGAFKVLPISKDGVLSRSREGGKRVTLAGWKQQGAWLIVVAHTASDLPNRFRNAAFLLSPIDPNSIRSWVRLYHIPTWVQGKEQLPWCSVEDLTNSSASVFDMKLVIPTNGGPPAIDFLREANPTVFTPRAEGATTESVRVTMDAQFNAAVQKERFWTRAAVVAASVAAIAVAAFAAGLIPGAPVTVVEATRNIITLAVAAVNPALLGVAFWRFGMGYGRSQLLPIAVALSLVVTTVACAVLYKRYALGGRPPRPLVEPQL